MQKPTHYIPLTTALPYFPNPNELVDGFKAILDKKWLTNFGQYCLEFENRLLNYWGIQNLNVTSCANATLALELTLRALNIKGKVLVPSFTFVSTVQSILNAGLIPHFIDIDPDNFCLSSTEVQKALKDDVGAVVPVLVYGNSIDFTYFDTIKEKGIPVIYDAAHAFGIQHENKSVASQGTASVFSFHATKLVNACEGGAVATLDKVLANKIRRMSNFGIINEEEVTEVGTNAKLSEVHALFGLHSLTHINEAINKRLEVILKYEERLNSYSPKIQFKKTQKTTTSNGQYCVVLFETAKLRDRVYSQLKENDIHARKYFYPPVHQLAPFKRYYDTPLPITEDISERVLCLPIHAELEEEHIDYICFHIKEAIKS